MADAPLTGDWPLTGRDEALQRLDAALCSPDDKRGMVISGPAGVGKTRLMRAAMELATARGARTSWALATSSARTIPLGALATATGELSGDPHRLVSEAIEALTGGDASTVVGVDDAHLLDDLSAHVVHQLVQQRAAAVVITSRAGEPAPDAVTALWKDGLLERVDLDPLTADETLTLLEAALRGHVDAGCAARLWTLSAGNALYLRHLVEGEAQAGRLRAIDGLWQWAGDLRLSVPLEELVSARMGRLSEPVLDVLAAVAVAGSLGIDVLDGLAGEAAVRQAEAAGIVRADVDGHRREVHLGHPLYGEVWRARLGPLGRRRVCAQVAAALATCAARRAGDAIRLAVLALDGGVDTDPALLKRATDEAFVRLDPALAERFARAAATDGDLEARISLAVALDLQNRSAEAEAELRAIEADAETDELRLTTAICLAVNLLFTARAPVEALGALRDAETTMESELMRVAAAASRCGLAALLGRPHEPLPYAAPALVAALPLMPRIMLCSGLTTGLADRGRFHAADAAAEDGCGLAAGSPLITISLYVLSSLRVRGLRLAGRVRDATSIADERRAGSRNAPGLVSPMGAALAGQVATYRGACGTAVRLLREAIAGLGPDETCGFRFLSLVYLTESLALIGDATGARAVLRQLDTELPPAYGFLDAELEVVRGWVAAAEGAVSEGVARMQAAAQLAAARGQLAPEAFALHAAVRLGDVSGSGRLAELATVVEGPRASTAAEHAAALAAGDGRRLSTVADEFHAMGDLLAAADAQAHAAVAFEKHGRESSSRVAAARALQLAELCEGAVTPALSMVTRPLPLTPREREIATLAAEGCSSKAIAERLVLSVRTVDGHLYRAYKKLGVPDRRELASLLKPPAAIR